MAEVIFDCEGNKIIIQCDENEKMEKIINRFLAKIDNNKNKNFIYLYYGNTLNKDLTFKQQANQEDKNRKKMNILAINNDTENTHIKKIISKDIICPQCNENILIEFNNFKINLKGCKNNHNQKNILLNSFIETQKINLNYIICDVCGTNKKSNTYNNEFYLCTKCFKDICPLCKSKHDPQHKIINYDEKNYKCKKHYDESINKFCKTCKEDLCVCCQNSHKNHDIIDLGDILINEDDLKAKLKELKNIIDKFKYKIDIIIDILNKMKNIIDIYYKINQNIIINFKLKNRNYHILLNINYIKNYNEKFIKEINDIIKDDKIYEYSFKNFYNEKGERFIGELINGKKNGKGIIFYNDGSKYEGEWKNDKMEGKGIFYYSSGIKYEGDWKNGIKEGKGVIYGHNHNKYEGDWKNDKIEGKGIFYYNNGDRYEGEWKSDKKEGKGIFYYNSGNKYEGEWKNDKKEGKGKFYFKNGKIEQVEWKNDKIIK